MSDNANVRAETVRMRGFIRAAETQASKILAMVEEPVEPDPPVDPPEEPTEPDPPEEPTEPDPPSVPDPPTGVAFATDFGNGGLSEGNEFFRWAVPKNTRVVSAAEMQDGAKPLTGTHCLEFHQRNQAAAEQRFTMGVGSRIVAMEFWLRYASYYKHRDGPSSDNNKFKALWGGGLSRYEYGDGPPRPKIVLETHRAGWLANPDTSYLRSLVTPEGSLPSKYTDQYLGDKNAGQVFDMFGTDEDHFTPGQWRRWRYLADTETGTMRAWIGNRRVIDITGFPLVSSASNAIRVFDCGYLMGSANSGWDQEQFLYMDAFRVWHSHPGW